MSLTDILNSRYSVRAFKQDAVDPAVLQEVFTAAQKSPSNCNVQPWKTYVVSGAKKDELKNQLVSVVMKQQTPEPEFNWKVAYQGIHRERQFGSAAALYNAMGIEREDKMKRNMAMLRNWAFFDAPHVAFFTMDKYLDIMGAVDVGIYAQTLTLLLKERGIDSCMQGALGQFPQPVKEFLNIPDEKGILFGMSFGYADDSADANKCRTDRADLDDAVAFIS
ncbi:MAG: nitroreductase [Oceanospirillaceae bacterium]|nr:nitroreductase [Oceanospirillaceae bacterium]MBT11923.1 nitroreductase [Oceanospirillaceae bacterium]|tara:strand:- start:22949 stop:23611 length:663 start_codon:yes stop_codon:yes gene_type:complete